MRPPPREEGRIIIFENNRRQIHIDLPQTLPEIALTTLIKMFGVTVTNHLSVSEHVIDVIIEEVE